MNELIHFHTPLRGNLCGAHEMNRFGRPAHYRADQVWGVTCRKCQVLIAQHHPNKTLAQLFRRVA